MKRFISIAKAAAVCAAILFSFQANGQTFAEKLWTNSKEKGVKLGVGLEMPVSFYSGGIEATGIRFGYGAKVYAHQALKNNWSLNYGIAFDSWGGRTSKDSKDNDYDTHIKEFMVRVPVTADKILIDGKTASLKATAGLWAGYAIKANKGNSLGWENRYIVSKLNGFDFGPELGFILKAGPVNVSATYLRGFMTRIAESQNKGALDYISDGKVEKLNYDAPGAYINALILGVGVIF